MSFANVVFVVIGKSKNVYIFMAAKVVLSVASDLFFIPHFGIYGVALSGLLVNCTLSIVCLSLLRRQNAFTVCAFGKNDIAALKDWARIGFFSGTQQFLDNIIYTIMICKMVNMVASQGDYWNANNFIWGYLLIPAAALSEVVKKDCKNGYNALKQKNYYFIVLAICLFWLVTIPLWQPFYSKVEGLENARVIFDITIKLVPFYVSYAICCIIDSIFVGLGKTKYNFITSLIVNLVYYGVFFLLYRANIITMSMNMIIIMFGFGMIFHLVAALIEEKIFLAREVKGTRCTGLCQYLFAISVKKATELCRLFLQFKALFQERLKP